MSPVRTSIPAVEQSAMPDITELASVSGDLGTGFLTTAMNGRRSMVIMLPGRALIQEEVRATVSLTGNAD
jgi:hypothetical protein